MNERGERTDGMAPSAHQLLDTLAASRILAILRRPDVAAVAVDLVARLRDDGIGAVECTIEQPGAFDALAALVAQRRPGELVGAGTVMTIADVDALVTLGVDFAVTPHLDERLLEHALASGLPMIPGVMTPSEVAAARRLGAPAVKLFPAGVLGTAYLRALLDPFAGLAVVATGGIGRDDADEWVAAGALAVGIGGKLFAEHGDAR